MINSAASRGKQARPAERALLLRLPLLGSFPFLADLLRRLHSGGPRLGKPDRDRLLAALDLAAGPAALQRAGLALLHRASDLGGCFSRIFPRHDTSPGCGKQSSRMKLVPSGGTGLPLPARFETVR